jgi:glycosyltransferase involved in cell wall biosynthesis
MLNYSSFALSASATGTFISRPEIVIATSPQLLVGLAGYWLALAKRVPFIFEVRDLWPESLSAVGLGLQTSMMNRTLGKIADFLYARASRIVAVSPAIREHLVTARGISPEKVSTVANGVETAIFHPDDSCAAAKERLKVSKKFVVGYIGTIGLAHGLETLLQAAESLKATAPDIAFLIVGEGAEKQRILHLATERNLTNCIFLGQQPREEIPALLNACDACLVMLRAADVFRTVIPTKMLEMMACARPVIVAVDGQARSIVEQANAGIFVPPENAAALVKAISVLKNNPDLGRQLGQNGRDHILAYYARRNTAAQYIAVLDEVLARSAMAAAVA